jgi:hypothetical protein
MGRQEPGHARCMCHKIGQDHQGQVLNLIVAKTKQYHKKWHHLSRCGCTEVVWIKLGINKIRYGAEPGPDPQCDAAPAATLVLNMDRCKK